MRVQTSYLLLFCILASGFYSLYIGCDQNWDLLNYHYYNPYSLLHHRLDLDIAPAGFQTFLNPLPDLIHYWGRTRLPLKLYEFLLGAFHGSVVIPLYLIANTIFESEANRVKSALIVLALALSFTGQNALTMIGTSFNDNLAAVFSTWGIFLSIKGHKDKSALLFAGSGLFIGAATGVKLTLAIIQCALFVALLSVGSRSDFKRALKNVAIFGAFSLAGFLIVYGWWGWELQRRFQNPFFPYYNSIFRSSWYPLKDIHDARFKISSLWDYILPPLRTLQGGRKTQRYQEYPFRDLRLFFFFIVSAIYMGSHFFRSPKDNEKKENGGRILFVLWWIGYFIWAKVFYYYRYFASLEILIPILGFWLMQRTPSLRIEGLKSRRFFVCLVTSIFVLITTQHGGYEKGTWNSDWVGIGAVSNRLPESGWVILDSLPDAYLIPSFPEALRFVRTDLGELKESTRLTEIANRELSGPGPFYLVTSHPREVKVGSISFKPQGDCFNLNTSTQPERVLCSLARN